MNKQKNRLSFVWSANFLFWKFFAFQFAIVWNIFIGFRCTKASCFLFIVGFYLHYSCFLERNSIENQNSSCSILVLSPTTNLRSFWNSTFEQYNNFLSPIHSIWIGESNTDSLQNAITNTWISIQCKIQLLYSMHLNGPQLLHSR